MMKRGLNFKNIAKLCTDRRGVETVVWFKRYCFFNNKNIEREQIE